MTIKTLTEPREASYVERAQVQSGHPIVSLLWGTLRDSADTHHLFIYFKRTRESDSFSQQSVAESATQKCNDVMILHPQSHVDLLELRYYKSFQITRPICTLFVY